MGGHLGGGAVRVGGTQGGRLVYLVYLLRAMITLLAGGRPSLGSLNIGLSRRSDCNPPPWAATDAMTAVLIADLAELETLEEETNRARTQA